jgi:hypothetical protein
MNKGLLKSEKVRRRKIKSRLEAEAAFCFREKGG